MADYETTHSTQQKEVSSPAPQPVGQSGETGWTTALKSIFWFLIVPGAVLLLVRWFLQP